MNKFDTKAWIESLEAMISQKLKKWDKHKKWENGEAVHLLWQWEQVLIKLDVFWEDKKEAVRLRFIGPREDRSFFWSGLVRKTYREVEHHVAHFAMSIMHPPIDPEDTCE